MNKMNFANGKALIPFITCGDPSLEVTPLLVRAAAENGADMVILGIPFSDPTAEGPVVQEANIRALKAGTSLERLFDMVRGMRTSIDIPLCFMTYANVAFSYGPEKFIATCEALGIDGLIFPDIPYEEKDEFAALCRAHQVKLISQIAPARATRIATIAKEAEGFVYVVAGNDEKNEAVVSDIADMVQLARQQTNLPCFMGGGIGTPEELRLHAKEVDGVIVDDAVVALVGEYGIDAPEMVGKFVAEMKVALSDE